MVDDIPTRTEVPVAASLDGWRAMPPHLRLLAHAFKLAGDLGVMPSVDKVAASSLAERQKGRPSPWFNRRAPAGVDVSDVTVPTRDGAVTVRTYRAAGATGVLPGLLYIHGGGWVMGGLDGVDPVCRHLALAAGVCVLSIDYRLAPEHPYPAALHDLADVLGWVRAQATDLQVDAARLAVAGESAGGNLSAALCLLDRGTTDVPLRAQVLLYPALDATLSSPFVQGFRGPGLTLADCQALVALYLGGTGSAADPLVSPLHAPDLAELPPALVVTAGADIVADDGDRYTQRLLEAGVPATLSHHPRAPHGFLGFDRLCPEAGRTVSESAAFLRHCLAERTEPAT